ncbi:MAG TPA: hypothetical protein VII56_13150 [Rhizomicrobium sp.]
MSGGITTSAFLDDLRRLELESPTRDAAAADAGTLGGEGVRARFVNTPQYFDYCNLLSLSLFHCGQLEAAMARERALDYFSQAHRWASEAEALSAADTDYAQWTSYVGATEAYFRRDEQTLRELVERLEVGDNRTITENLLRGLSRRGEPDYEADYSRFPQAE